MSASPELKVLPGFPFTLMHAETPVDVEGKETTRPEPVIYKINLDSRTIDFFLGNPKTTNGSYPVRMPFSPTLRRFYFLKIVVDVTSVCKTYPGSGPPFNTNPNQVCYTEDANTVSVTVERLTSIPKEKRPVFTNPSTEEEEESGGWTSILGYPSGQYTIYLPLVCFNFGTTGSVSWVGDYSEYIRNNGIGFDLIQREWGGDSGRMWNNGSPFSFQGNIRAGDPAALAMAYKQADELDPEYSQYVLSSL